MRSLNFVLVANFTVLEPWKRPKLNTVVDVMSVASVYLASPDTHFSVMKEVQASANTIPFTGSVKKMAGLKLRQLMLRRMTKAFLHYEEI